MLQKFTSFAWAHWLALLIAVAINALVLTNTILHHPKIGYDVTEHLKYAQVLPYRLPNDQDTSEFFSAPLPYFLPSLVDKACMAANGWNCTGVAGKSAQGINFFLSIGITILLWKLSSRLRPGSESFRVSLLAMLGILTVYYRTFSQARGEPYVAFFVVLLLYLVARLLQKAERLTWKDGLVLGLVLGLLILSRQWGILVYPALAVPLAVLFFKDRPAGNRMFKVLVVAGLVAFVVGGWFYLRLYSKYGSFTPFNQESLGFSLSNHPASFYRNLYIEHLEIFKNPVRPYFDKTLLPIFYSDTWGDYWGFFTYIWIDNPYVGALANGEEMAPYLGRVNLVSIFPTLILLAGLALSGVQLVKAFLPDKPDPERILMGFVFIAILCSGLGYLWFLFSYPLGQFGNTNKATYMIQVFMLLPLPAAALLELVRAWKPWAYRVTMVLLLLVFLHNLPALVTRFFWYIQ